MFQPTSHSPPFAQLPPHMPYRTFYAFCPTIPRISLVLPIRQTSIHTHTSRTLVASRGRHYRNHRLACIIPLPWSPSSLLPSILLCELLFPDGLLTARHTTLFLHVPPLLLLSSDGSCPVRSCGDRNGPPRRRHPHLWRCIFPGSTTVITAHCEYNVFSYSSNSKLKGLLPDKGK